MEKPIIIRAKTENERDNQLKESESKGAVITEKFYLKEHKLPYQARGFKLVDMKIEGD